MGIPNWTHQIGCNAVAAQIQYAALFTGAGAGTTGANEAIGGSYARVAVGAGVPDGAGDNNWSQVAVYCPAGTYTEAGAFTTPSGLVLAIPSGFGATGHTTGGTLAAGTYYYVVTAVNPAGETTVSAEQSATVTGTTASVSLACSAVTGAASYNWYRGTTSGGENKLLANTTGITYTDTGTAGTTQSPPGTNTASTFVYSAAFTGGAQSVSGSNPIINVVLGYTS